jgi:hypothetical protein
MGYGASISAIFHLVYLPQAYTDRKHRLTKEEVMQKTRYVVCLAGVGDYLSLHLLCLNKDRVKSLEEENS